MNDQRPSERIEADLRESIANGQYSPGQQLPSMRALMKRYAVANQTIANVIGRLRSDGLIEGRTGAGLFVREKPAVQQVTRHQLGEQQRRDGYRTEQVEARRATPDDLEQLGAEAATVVLVLTQTKHDASGSETVRETTVLAADQNELVYELPID